MEEELKPCPFCGMSPHRQGDEYSERVVCQCGACTEWNDRYSICVKIWNTRATDPLLKQMAEALDGLLYVVKRISDNGWSDSLAIMKGITDMNKAEQALQSYRAHINQIEKPECEGE